MSDKRFMTISAAVDLVSLKMAREPAALEKSVLNAMYRKLSEGLAEREDCLRSWEDDKLQAKCFEFICVVLSPAEWKEIVAALDRLDKVSAKEKP